MNALSFVVKILILGYELSLYATLKALKTEPPYYQKGTRVLCNRIYFALSRLVKTFIEKEMNIRPVRKHFREISQRFMFLSKTIGICIFYNFLLATHHSESVIPL